MLVVEDKKALVLALGNPNRVTTVIPTAKVLAEKKGKTLVAVRHSLDVFKVLRNIDINAPHPIKHYYEWPCAYKAPMAHQIETAAFLSSYTRAYCLNGMGSAKTLSTLWAYDYLRSEGRAKRMLVVAPLSTLDRTWADEVFRHFPHLECTVLHGTREKRIKLLKEPSQVFVINHDGLKVILKEIVDAKFDVVVLDELTQIARNARSQRWKAAKQVVDASQYTWGLTGTPIPNDPCDAFGQIKLITPERAPRSYSLFQDMVSRLVGPYKRHPLPNASQTIFDMMQPAIRYATRDCIDLPETVYVTREVPMSPDRMAMYRRMADQKMIELQSGGKVLGVNEAVVAMKLVQILCGAVVANDGEIETIEAPERIQETIDLIDQAEGKVIVFTPFLGSVDYISDKLREEYGHNAVGTIDGRVPKHERDKVFSSFQNGGEIDVIVAQPAAMSHGLTLTAGSMVVWFAPVYSNETYEQANARIVRPGQKRTTVIAHIEGSPLERQIYERLQKRQKLQGSLLSLVEGLTK